MRSLHDNLLLAGCLALAACGNDVAEEPPVDDACESSVLTYQNFGEPFLLDWCRGCHSSGLLEGMRQDAPMGTDFDDLELVRSYTSKMTLRAAGPMPTMPPAAGPSPEERALLGEWLACGAP